MRLEAYPVQVVGVQVPDSWPGWTDEERLAWVRGALKSLGRPKSGPRLAYATAYRRLRGSLSTKIWRSQQDVV